MRFWGLNIFFFLEIFIIIKITKCLKQKLLNGIAIVERNDDQRARTAGIGLRTVSDCDIPLCSVYRYSFTASKLLSPVTQLHRFWRHVSALIGCQLQLSTLDIFYKEALQEKLLYLLRGPIILGATLKFWAPEGCQVHIQDSQILDTILQHTVTHLVCYMEVLYLSSLSC
jgi:hypothetical protein